MSVGSRHLGRPGGARGAYAVEFALVLMLLVTLVLGTFDLSRILWLKAETMHLAEEGARFAAVRGSKSGAAVTQQDVANFLQAREVGLSVMTVTVSWPSTGGNPDKTPGKTVSVTVSAPFYWNLLPLETRTVSSTSRILISF